VIFKSPYKDVEIPGVSLPEFVLESARQRGDKPALIDGPTGRTITYQEFVASVEGLASGLAAATSAREMCSRSTRRTSPNMPLRSMAW
jgi:hypothetical protein